MLVAAHALLIVPIMFFFAATLRKDIEELETLIGASAPADASEATDDPNASDSSVSISRVSRS